MKKLKRRVTVTFGRWAKDTDFIIEPHTFGDEEELQTLWIEEAESGPRR